MCIVIWRVWRGRKKKKNSDWFYSCFEILIAVVARWASGMLMTGMLFSSRGSWPLKSQPRHKSIPICHRNIRGSHLVAPNWGQFVWREACVRSERYMCKSRQLYSALMAQSNIFSAWALRALWRFLENPAEKNDSAEPEVSLTDFFSQWLEYYRLAGWFDCHICMLGRVVGILSHMKDFSPIHHFSKSNLLCHHTSDFVLLIYFLFYCLV